MVRKKDEKTAALNRHIYHHHGPWRCAGGQFGKIAGHELMHLRGDVAIPHEHKDYADIDEIAAVAATLPSRTSAGAQAGGKVEVYE